MKRTVHIRGVETPHEVFDENGCWSLVRNGRPVPVEIREASPGRLSLLIDGSSYEVHVEPWPGGYRVHTRGADFIATVEDPRRWQRGSGGLSTEGRQRITAPMPGKVVRVLVEEGQEVDEGQGLVVVEAMKMQNEIPSPKQGVVEQISVAPGDTVEHGAVLVVVA